MICFAAFHDSDSDEDEQLPIIPEQQDYQLEDSQHAVPSAHDSVSFDLASFLQKTGAKKLTQLSSSLKNEWIPPIHML